MIAFAEAEVGRLREENGVLVLTDMYGATPANIACRLASLPNVRVLAGVNLPMLVRSVCYRTCPIDQLVEKALMGAAKGVHMIAAPASPGELLAPTGSACLPANSPAGSGVGMPASASVVASRADEGPAR
jgi:PTS system ascorbate-specific IIA component